MARSYFRIAPSSLVSLALLLNGIIAVSPVAGDVALTISTANRGDKAGLDESLGWQFTLNQPVNVTDLGVWDRAAVFGPDTPGLVESHLVTIWDSAGNPVAQATVPSGTNNTLVDVFRYAPLPAPVLLQPGTYTIGAYYQSPADHLAFFADPIITSPYLSYDNSMDWLGNGPPDVFAPSQEQGYFGPNFQFQPAGKLILSSVTVHVSPDHIDHNGEAVFTITRSTPTSAPLVVKFAMSGDAEQDADYVLNGLSDEIVIAAGETSVTVSLTAITQKTKGHEEAVMILQPDANYSLSHDKDGKNAFTAKVTIENKAKAKRK